MKEKIGKLEEEISKKQFVEPPKQIENAEDKAKMEKYYELCIRMGEKFLTAETTSQAIIEKANEEAAQILVEAQNESKRLINELVEEARKQAEAVFEAVRLHKQKEYEIRDSLEVSLQKIRELINSIESLGRTDA